MFSRIVSATFVILFIATGCKSVDSRLTMQRTYQGESVALLEQQGTTELRLPDDSQTSITSLTGTNSLLMRNAGVEPILGIRCWGYGGADLIRLLQSDGNKLRSFALLPGEFFVFSVVDKSSPQALELPSDGIFFWSLPQDPEIAKACFTKSRRAELDDVGISLVPPYTFTKSDEMQMAPCWVQLKFASPLPHTSVKIAWNRLHEGPEPQIWINTRGPTWTKVSTSVAQVTPLRPIVLDDEVSGLYQFNLRLALPVDATSVQTFNALTIERTLDTSNATLYSSFERSFGVAVYEPSHPLLEIKLVGP